MINRIQLENLGTVNKNKVTIGSLELWFSYETIVCFSQSGRMFCSENQWSKTTGKLLNELCPDKKQRLSAQAFNLAVNNMFERMILEAI